MHDAVLNAHKESKDLEKVLKDLTKEVHALNIEKEAAEKREIGSDKKDLHESLECIFFPYLDGFVYAKIALLYS